MVNAEIITIGDEILIGQLVDTNSAWIAKHLNSAGINVYQISSVSDNAGHILKALDEASQRADIILITGGLGPTKDDITKKTLARYFGIGKMLVHQPTLDYITDIFTKRGIAITELNRLQAEVPENATVIFNTCGTAPGMYFEQNGKIYVSMPGVPYEMEAMLPKVVELLFAKTGQSAIYHKSLMTYGIPESLLAEQIEDWEGALPIHIKLAYLPEISSGIKLRLSATGDNKDLLNQQVDEEFGKLIPRLGNAVYGYEPDSLASVIGKLLTAKKASIATAESCTGGRVSHLITLIPGSSEYFKGGIVSYSNEAKMNILEVKQTTLEQFGTVSRQTVEEMALGAKRVLNADYAIATSGIAGPGGGTFEKPIGLCWFAVASPKKVASYSQMLTSDRAGNITRAAANALNYMRLLLLED
ncbi:MAG: competence/damage-inducible protein A [Prevotellaceae bacterium]|jgi:nicotinamide-nucleotide amidase|nr:competence/damage-inducible protein A [Prevotellaceae bacterium]